jgi:hypothetical protein
MRRNSTTLKNAPLADKAREELIGPTEFAARINYAIATRTLREWIDKKIVTAAARGADGKIIAWLWVEEIIKYLQSQRDSDELRAAKIRSENARAAKIEMQNEETEGTLVRAEDVVATWAAAFSVCKGKLMGLAVTLADELAGITDTVIRKEIIQDAIQEILEELGTQSHVSSSRHADDDSDNGP